MNTGVLEAIEQAAAEGNDVWEMVVSAGIQASDKGDESRWLIGDLALLVRTEYGEDSIGKWAKDIKCPVDRVKEYRTVCGFWDRELSARADFLAELKNIYYTHYREAMRLKDYDAAVEFIEECAMNDWSVEAARLELDKRLGKKAPPAKLVDSELPVYRLDKCKVTFELAPDAAARLFDTVDNKRVVRLVVYEVLNQPRAGVREDEGRNDKSPFESEYREDMEPQIP